MTRFKEINSKSEICEALDQVYAELITWLKEQKDEDFEVEKVIGKWTTGQHIKHLIKSTKPLNKGLRLSRLSLKAMFGKKNDRPVRSYEEVVLKYREKLEEGYEDRPQYLPEAIKNEQKAALIAKLEEECSKLIAVIGKWKEEHMDLYVVPHPLIGKMTIREMLFFTIYHTLHHLKALQESY